MKIKILLNTMMLTGVLLFSNGCATESMNTVEAAMPEGRPVMVSDQRILTDPSLGRNVYVIGVNEAWTANGYKKVQIQVYNRTRSAKSFTYKVEWFDADGMLITSASDHRTPMTIEGGQKRSIAVLATSPKAVDFRFTFLESLGE